MVELIAGSVIGVITSLVISEWYQRRNKREMDLQIQKLQVMHDNLEEQLLYAVEYSEKAATTAGWIHKQIER